MKKFFGNYQGIVIQNNDPEKSGKVKIYVPHISPAIYEKWIQEKANKKIKFVGANLNEDITPILEDLKKVLPWAECAAPLVGENSSGRFNNFYLQGSNSDTNFYKTFVEEDGTIQDIGNKPGKIFEDDNSRLSDAFTSAANNINRPNPYSYYYRPNTYSNMAKGAFCIPSVGSHVWVFFREGNPLFPVYFATSFGSEDWKGIYNSGTEPGIDYPGTFENKSESITDYNNNVETYRNKYVINQKGGSLEFINTDLKETLRLTHYSGSFIEINNQTKTELATTNNQKLVLNDEYSTVNGFKNEYTGKNLDESVKRDKYKKVGSLNVAAFERWKDIVASIQDNKQLFEIRRAKNNTVYYTDGSISLKRNSLLQKREGTFTSFPVTDGSITYDALDNTDTVIDDGYTGISNNSGDNPSTIDKIYSTAGTSSGPSNSDWVSESGDTFKNGIGKSLSTQDGTWVIEDRKDKIKEILEIKLKDLIELENQLGIGGSEIIQITKHKVETIGLLMNDFGSIRFDDIGKLLSNEVLINDNAVYVNKKESPLVEYVHVQDLPGGNYTLEVCNRFNVLVGAGGLNLKSYGPTNITGTVTNIVGEQVNIGSQNEINIDGGTINISADILRLRNKRQRQIFIEHSMGINNNLIIGGGLHVEGEVFIQHITAPREYQVTEKTKLYGELVSGKTFTATGPWVGIQTITIVSSSTDLIENYDHSHVFSNLPLTLKNSNSEVRQTAKILNDGSTRSVATEQHNIKK
jgi:hypothetical protein